MISNRFNTSYCEESKNDNGNEQSNAFGASQIRIGFIREQMVNPIIHGEKRVEIIDEEKSNSAEQNCRLFQGELVHT